MKFKILSINLEFFFAMVYYERMNFILGASLYDLTKVTHVDFCF